MAVTVTAALVTSSIPDQTRPPGHAGWDNPKGDPNWIPDVDWHRRVQLVCTGSAGEVGTIVNWEICDGTTIPFKTTAEINATTAGTTASPFGPLVNNSTTWTVWATTGSAAAAAAKYTNTGTPCLSSLRANGPSVQVVLGDAGKPGRKWTVAAFLPGGGRTPAATAAVNTLSPTGVVPTSAEPTILPSWGEDTEVPEEEPETTPPPVEPDPEPGPDPDPDSGETETPPEGATVQQILDWVGDDEDRAFVAYEAEMERERPRATLMEALTKMLDE